MHEIVAAAEMPPRDAHADLQHVQKHLGQINGLVRFVDIAPLNTVDVHAVNDLALGVPVSASADHIHAIAAVDQGPGELLHVGVALLG